MGGKPVENTRADSVKSAKPRKRAKIGDIVEIPLPHGGFGYAQYVYNYTPKPRWGALIRVFPGVAREPVRDFEEMVNGKEQFFSFFLVGPAVSQHLVTVVGHVDLPPEGIQFPLFKACIRPKTGPRIWYLWDGEKEWRVGTLPPEQTDLSLREIINLVALQQRIETGWSPRDEV